MGLSQKALKIHNICIFLFGLLFFTYIIISSIWNKKYTNEFWCLILYILLACISLIFSMGLSRNLLDVNFSSLLFGFFSFLSLYTFSINAFILGILVRKIKTIYHPNSSKATIKGFVLKWLQFSYYKSIYNFWIKDFYKSKQYKIFDMFILIYASILNLL